MAESVCKSSLVEACQMETTGGLGSHDSFLNRYNKNTFSFTYANLKKNKRPDTETHSSHLKRMAPTTLRNIRLHFFNLEFEQGMKTGRKSAHTKPKTEQQLSLSSYLTQTATDLIMIIMVCQDIC